MIKQRTVVQKNGRIEVRADTLPEGANVEVTVRTVRAPTLETVRNHRDAILQLATRHGASNVRVVGSVARGETDAESDVDLLVDLEPGRSLFDLGGLMADLETLLGGKVDVLTERGLRPKVRELVLRDAQAL